MKNKNNIELVKGSGNKIIIKGNDLSCRWFDSYILVWSNVEHPYEEKDYKKKVKK